MEKKGQRLNLVEKGTGSNVSLAESKQQLKKDNICPISGFELFSDSMENERNNSDKVSLDAVKKTGFGLESGKQSQGDWKKKDGFFSLNYFSSTRNNAMTFLSLQPSVTNQNYSDTDKNNNNDAVYIEDSKSFLKEPSNNNKLLITQIWTYTENSFLEKIKEEELDNEILDFISTLFAFQGDIIFENPAFNEQLEEEEEKLFMPYARRNPIYESNFEFESNFNFPTEILGQSSNLSPSMKINKIQYKKETSKNTNKLEIRDITYGMDGLEQTELPTQWVSIHDIFNCSSKLVSSRDHLIKS